jgi:hypothetical protein
MERDVLKEGAMPSKQDNKTPEDRIKELESLVGHLQSQNQKYRDIIQRYEENGPAKLYYSLQRKSWEMADLLNARSLKELDMEDAKNKEFDRLKVIWQDAAGLATSIKTLGDVAGVTGDEQKDTQPKKGSFLDTIV